MKRIRQSLYTPPQVILHTVICPERVICDSAHDYFLIYDLTGDEDSAGYGYESLDNGEY